MSTQSLLRPAQVEESRQEISNINRMLQAPAHERKHITDVGAMTKRRNNLATQLEAETPRPYKEEELDDAVRSFKRLGEEIKVGMLSSEEMRRNPPGAVQRNISWEKKNKSKIMEYKHSALRLLAGGDSPHPDIGDALPNIEMLRSHSTNYDLSMQGSQIPKERDIHLGGMNSTTLKKTYSYSELQKIATSNGIRVFQKSREYIEEALTARGLI